MKIIKEMILFKSLIFKILLQGVLLITIVLFSSNCIEPISKKQQLDIKFLRSLSGLTPHYPTYDADKHIAQSIVEWSNNILLAGKHWDLDIEKEAIFQLPSQAFNIYTYVISIDSTDIIEKILQETDAFQEDLEEKIGIQISGLDVVGGILTLNRKLYYDPGEDKKRDLPSDARRCSFRDNYWLDVYVKKAEIKEEIIIPLLQIYAGFVTPYYYRSVNENEISNYYNNLVEYFQEPDDVILDWHELANVLDLQRSRPYLQACFNGAGTTRKIFAAYENSPQINPPLVVIDDPTDNDIPIYYRVTSHAYPFNPVFEPQISSPYAVSDLEDPAFVFSSSELNKITSLWRLDYEYVHVIEDPVQIPESIPDEDIIPPSYGSPYSWRLSHKFTQITSIPNPSLPNTDFGLAVTKLLLQESFGQAAYIGEGLFRVKASSLVQLAAGSGNWGSPEVATASVTIVVGTVKVAGTVLSVGGGVVVIGAGFYKWVMKDEIQNELAGCYEKTGSDCITCVKNSRGWSANEWEGYAGYLAFGGAILTVATGGVALGIFGAAAGVWAMMNSAGVEDDYLSGCSYRL